MVKVIQYRVAENTSNKFDQLYHKISNLLSEISNFRGLNCFQFLECFGCSKVYINISSGKRFSLFERSSVINFFVKDTLSNIARKTKRSIWEMINFFK